MYASESKKWSILLYLYCHLAKALIVLMILIVYYYLQLRRYSHIAEPFVECILPLLLYQVVQNPKPMAANSVATPELDKPVVALECTLW